MNKLDLTSPQQILRYLENYNNEVLERVNHGEELWDLISNFENSGIAKDKLGKKIIQFYHFFDTNFYFNGKSDCNVFKNIAKNEYLLTDKTFRKTVHQIKADRDLDFTAFMIANKLIENMYPGENKEKSYPVKSKELVFRKNKIQEYDKLVKQMYKIASDVEEDREKEVSKLFSFSDKNTTIWSTGEQSNNQNVATNIFKIDAKKYYQGLTNLIEVRNKFKYSYAIDIQSDVNQNLISSLEQESNIEKKIVIIENYIKKYQGQIMDDVSLFIRIEDLTNKSDKVVAYLESVGINEKVWLEFDKYNLTHIKILKIKRYLVLQIFFFLGLPPTQIDKFMNLFGINFGKGYNTLSSKNDIQESYIRRLIKAGISYNTINSLIQTI